MPCFKIIVVINLGLMLLSLQKLLVMMALVTGGVASAGFLIFEVKDEAPFCFFIKNTDQIGF